MLQSFTRTLTVLQSRYLYTILYLALLEQVFTFRILEASALYLLYGVFFSVDSNLYSATGSTVLELIYEE